MTCITLYPLCGDDIVPEEIDYFEQATKHCIHSRIDMNDVYVGQD